MTHSVLKHNPTDKNSISVPAAAAHAAKLRQRKAEQLAAFERQWKSAVAQLDDHLRTLTVAAFFDQHGADPERALRHAVHQSVRKAPSGAGVGGASDELARRAGKRGAPGSPGREGGGEGGRSIEGVLGTGKKARSAAEGSGSVSRGAGGKARANATSPTAVGLSRDAQRRLAMR